MEEKKKEITACPRIANILLEISTKQVLSHMTLVKWLGRALTLHEQCTILGTVGFLSPENIKFLALEEMRVVHGAVLTWAGALKHLVPRIVLGSPGAILFKPFSRWCEQSTWGSRAFQKEQRCQNLFMLLRKK